MTFSEMCVFKNWVFEIFFPDHLIKDNVWMQESNQIFQRPPTKCISAIHWIKKKLHESELLTRTHTVKLCTSVQGCCWKEPWCLISCSCINKGIKMSWSQFIQLWMAKDWRYIHRSDDWSSALGNFSEYLEETKANWESIFEHWRELECHRLLTNISFLFWPLGGK